VLSLPGDDAATLSLGGVRQVITTDHLRAFWQDPWLFGRIAALHALGDVWAMGATPQAALAQITLPRMTAPLQERWLDEIMQAAAEVFSECGAAIVGGHSTQGAELTVGFTVTGIDDSGLSKDSPAEGDALVLTRPLGSGTLLAAEMSGKARGDDMEALLKTLATPQGDAARLLAPHAKAMTDVTGFGLAGHAARMLSGSGLTVELDLDALSVFSGAEDLADRGIKSSIWQDNRDAVRFDGPSNARAALLFDPQTAGGLLAAVAFDQAEKLKDEIVALGHDAAVVGRLGPGSDFDGVAR
jgi:selenide,water dikinase